MVGMGYCSGRTPHFIVFVKFYHYHSIFNPNRIQAVQSLNTVIEQL